MRIQIKVPILNLFKSDTDFPLSVHVAPLGIPTLFLVRNFPELFRARLSLGSVSQASRHPFSLDPRVAFPPGAFVRADRYQHMVPFYCSSSSTRLLSTRTISLQRAQEQRPVPNPWRTRPERLGLRKDHDLFHNVIGDTKGVSES